jgi:cellulose biosynthesis protein BcsQ
MQIRLAVISNAGGSGKTTLSVHLAYELGNADSMWHSLTSTPKVR